MSGNTFGARFKYARTLRSRTQSDVADEIGVHSQTVSDWERDVLSGLPPAELMRAAADALDVDFLWLAFDEGKAPRRERVAQNTTAD